MVKTIKYETCKPTELPRSKLSECPLVMSTSITTKMNFLTLSPGKYQELWKLGILSREAYSTSGPFATSSKTPFSSTPGLSPL